jgi:hypothetical protein
LKSRESIVVHGELSLKIVLHVVKKLELSLDSIEPPKFCIQDSAEDGRCRTPGKLIRTLAAPSRLQEALMLSRGATDKVGLFWGEKYTSSR